MEKTWLTVPATDVKPGERVRHRDYEFDVARIDDPFLGRPNMLCFIEDTPDRWFAYPAGTDAEVAVLRSGVA